MTLTIWFMAFFIGIAFLNYITYAGNESFAFWCMSFVMTFTFVALFYIGGEWLSNAIAVALIPDP